MYGCRSPPRRLLEFRTGETFHLNTGRNHWERLFCSRILDSERRTQSCCPLSFSLLAHHAQLVGCTEKSPTAPPAVLTRRFLARAVRGWGSSPSSVSFSALPSILFEINFQAELSGAWNCVGKQRAAAILCGPPQHQPWDQPHAEWVTGFPLRLTCHFSVTQLRGPGSLPVLGERVSVGAYCKKLSKWGNFQEN